jgi:hypothetical protein
MPTQVRSPSVTLFLLYLFLTTPLKTLTPSQPVYRDRSKRTKKAVNYNETTLEDFERRHGDNRTAGAVDDDVTWRR